MTNREGTLIVEKYLQKYKASVGRFEMLSAANFGIEDDDIEFMRQCRERTTNEQKCEYCDLRFKCYTEPWKRA